MAKRQRLSDVSYEELQAELRRREKHVEALVRKRDKLAAELAEVEGQIREAGGAARTARHGTTRRRPQNAMNLADALAKLLRNQTMTVTEIAEAVQKAGYKTSSSNFRIIVNQTLLKDPRFKRVGRGQYTVRRGKG